MLEPQAEPTVASLRTGPAGDPSVEGLLPDASIPEQYEQLLAHLSCAERELEAGGIAGRSPHLEQASAVVFDLLYALDFRRGGELVPRLAALYGYIGNQLLNIGRTGDRAELSHLRDMIATLRQSWYDNVA